MLARIRKSVEEKDSGFTLVELLVVMIIIGVLAAIAIPVFANQKKKAVDTSIKSDLRSVAQNVETTFVDTQTYPSQASYSTVPSAVGTTTLSANNNVQYKSTTAGYCLRGWNTGGTTSGTGTGTTGTYFIWDSATGGLVTGAAAASSTNC